jgi:hypothetical protein
MPPNVLVTWVNSPDPFEPYSDDGKLALVEFVAYSRDAFKDLLADTRPDIKVFIKGKDKREDIEKEFKKHKKDFNLDTFGTVAP